MARKMTNEEFLQKIKNSNINDVEPLEEYKGRHTKIKFKCLNSDCGFEWEAQPGNIFIGRRCPKCGIKKRAESKTLSQEEFDERFQQTGNKGVRVLGKYSGIDEQIECECVNNKEHPHFFKSAYSLFRGEGCPYCSGARLTEDRKFKNLYPNLMQYLKNKEDGEKAPHSRDIIELLCPDCGYNKKISMSNFIRSGFVCPICGDGVSFPNRVLRKLLMDKSILRQASNLEIEWRPLNWEKRVFFDGKIEINNKTICIEMQGKQHKSGLWAGKVSKGIFERDEYKRKKCQECGYIEIEIDCTDTSPQNIKEQILNSKLCQYLDFSNVDWESVLDLSWDSLLVQICKEYDNSYLAPNEIEKKFGLANHSFVQYARRGLRGGLLNRYNKEDEEKRRLLCSSKYVYELYDSNDNLLTEDIGVGHFQISVEKITGQKIPQKTLNSTKTGNINKLKGFKIKKRIKTQKDKERLSGKYFDY